ncbi:MAG: hypothetical protein RLY58_2161 [Pseudomonadota bacterium]|jgi:transcriptional regulator with XRE-family HTH domain
MTLETDKIGERLKQIRGSYTQAEFSDKLGFSKTTIFNYEKGVRIPDAHFLLRLYEQCGTDPLWLLTGVRNQTGAEEILDEHLSLLAYYVLCSPEMQKSIKQLIRTHIDDTKPWMRDENVRFDVIDE